MSWRGYGKRGRGGGADFWDGWPGLGNLATSEGGPAARGRPIAKTPTADPEPVGCHFPFYLGRRGKK